MFPKKEGLALVFVSGTCVIYDSSSEWLAPTCQAVGGVPVVGVEQAQDGDEYYGCCPADQIDVSAIIASATASGEFGTNAIGCFCENSVNPAIAGFGIYVGTTLCCASGSAFDC